MYKDTKDSKYKKIINRRIYFLHKQNNVNELTNEQLVLLIQKYNNPIYWEKLYENTEATIYDVFYKYVRPFDKINNKEETLTVLKTGWANAIRKYDIYKATANFHPFCSYIVHQEYINQMNRRSTKEKDGVSVKTMPVSNMNFNESDEIDKMEAIDKLFEDVTSKEAYENFELKELIDLKLNVLKTYYPMSYLFIKEYYYNDKSQVELAEEYNIQQTSISRHIRRGLKFLKLRFTKTEKEFLNIIN